MDNCVKNMLQRVTDHEVVAAPLHQVLVILDFIVRDFAHNRLLPPQLVRQRKLEHKPLPFPRRVAERLHIIHMSQIANHVRSKKLPSSKKKVKKRKEK